MSAVPTRRHRHEHPRPTSARPASPGVGRVTYGSGGGGGGGALWDEDEDGEEWVENGDIMRLHAGGDTAEPWTINHRDWNGFDEQVVPGPTAG
jgi:hypothetical protein